MIPAAAITEWSTSRPWPTRRQIEQDLVLARLIVAIYSNQYLAEELVFRGGTCLHHIRLPVPYRYSEDLDFVRRSGDGIGRIFDELRAVAADVGLTVGQRVLNEHPKMVLRAVSEDDPAVALRIKVEVNTHERSPALPYDMVTFGVASSWFTGRAEVLTFARPELVATKIRALYQRKKGRDLFDLWLALNVMRLDPGEIIESFDPYRPDGYTGLLGIANLRAKIDSVDFRNDLTPLVAAAPPGYEVRAAAEEIIEVLLSRLS